MKWTKTTIILVIAAAAVVPGAGGAALGIAFGGQHAAAALPAQSPAAAASPAPKPSRAPAKPAVPAPQPTKTVTAPPPPVIINNQPVYQAPPTVATPPPGSWYDGEDPANVVVNYYDDISSQDFTDAWNMGGDNIAAQNGQTYDSWVAGYDGVGPESASVYDEGSDGQGNEIVHTDLYPAGASSPSYTGWYTVDPATMTIISGYLQSTG